MSDLVRPDPRVNVSGFESSSRTSSESWHGQGSRVFNGPDGSQYRWRPSSTNADILVGSNPLVLPAYQT